MNFHCVTCTKVLELDRLRKGSHFCSTECHRTYRKERRSELAKRKCRLCGRGSRKRKELEAVPTEHTELQVTA